MIPRGEDGYYHPSNEAEICELAKFAADNGLKVRVRGSSHSVPPAIYTSPPAIDPHSYQTWPPHDGNINIYLDRMIRVRFNDETMQVTVEAGCHLGDDPADPTHTSSVENSLFYQLDQKGWAFPDTGGIIHQTVGGFLSTGSSGSSMQHSVGEQIIAFRLVDGLGNVNEFQRSDDLDSPFYAVGVSMGLLGIITSVTFQCVERFDIVGTEKVSNYDDCEVDFFGNGSSTKPDLEAFFRQVEHARLMWFPQQGLERIVVWRAQADKDTSVGKKTYRRYHQFPTVLGQELPAQWLTSMLMRGFDVLNPPPPTSALGKGWKSIAKWLYPRVASLFLLPVGCPHEEEFREIWWQGLPMDNRVDYQLMPTRFTELWVSLSDASEVMQTLLAHYDSGGFDATSTYSCEIYPTPQSKFWMSPAYQRDVVKVDPFWFGFNRGDPDALYFPKYWDLLKKFDYRLHWGKSLSHDVDYLKDQYPRWDDFMALREQVDPHQVFLTDYWREHLGVEGP
jgi:hypothetical protein